MDSCYFMLRSLPSLPARLAAHDAYACEVAEWLADRLGVVRVLHLALPGCPGHESRERDFTGASGLLSIVLHERYSQAQTDAFVEGLHYFAIGFSWGGAHSLALPYNIPSMHTATAWPPTDWGNVGDSVRLHTGLEDPRDLIAGLKQAMETYLGA